MVCCGSKIPKISNPESLLANEIRKFDDMKTTLTLNEYNLEFDPTTGGWNTNFSDKPEIAIDDKDNKLGNLKEQLEMKKQELNTVEKQYLAKVAKLYIMIQTHCQMKNEIYELFNKYNVGIEVKDVEKIVEIKDNNMEMENISYHSDPKPEDKKPLLA